MQEIWKNATGLEFHQVSNMGRIRTVDRTLPCGDGFRKYKGKIKKPSDNGGGYLIVTLCDNYEKTNFYVHRLVAEAFVENIGNKPRVNHKDTNKKNNHFSNLEWTTAKENTEHAIKMGLMSVVKRKNHRYVLDTQTGIFYDSVLQAASAKSINWHLLYTWLSKPHRNKSSLIYT